MATSTKKATPSKETVAPEIHPAEVVKELPLEKVIEQTLTKNNITKRVLTALKEKYGKGDLVLKSPTDTENLLIIKEARKEVRKVGIIVEKLCSKGREEAVKTQRAWIAKEKEIMAEVSSVQDPLDEQIKIYEDEQERLEKIEQERKDNVYNERQTQLIKMGAVFANGCLNINDLSIETGNIREADEEIYTETILPLFQRQYEKNEQAKIAEQKRKDDEAAALKQQQDQLAEEQRKFREEQEQFKKQQQEVQAQRDEVARQEKEKMEAVVKAKCVRLESLGMYYGHVSENYSYSDILVAKKEFASMDDVNFEQFMQDLTSRVEAKKQILIKEQEEKRAHELEAAKQKAIREEQERAAEEQRQAKIKAEQEEARRLEEAAKATDKQKWFDLITIVTAVPMPEFKSSVYKSKASALFAKMNEIKAL